jgi:hypothetical protein
VSDGGVEVVGGGRCRGIGGRGRHGAGEGGAGALEGLARASTWRARPLAR